MAQFGRLRLREMASIKNEFESYSLEQQHHNWIPTSIISYFTPKSRFNKKKLEIKIIACTPCFDMVSPRRTSPRAAHSPRFGGARTYYRSSIRPSRKMSCSSSTDSSNSSDDGSEDETWTDSIGGVTVHLTRMGGQGSSLRCQAWKADMKVYMDAKGMGDCIREQTQSDNFHYIEDECLAKMDRERKAMIWFSVDESVRRQHLLDLCDRDASSEDVWRRLHERGCSVKPYEALPPLSLDCEEGSWV